MKLLIVPGLGDGKKLYELASSLFFKGIDVKIHVFGWKSSLTFKEGMKSLLQEIDSFAGEDKLNLAGASAGASACFNAYYLKKKKINCLINICGRLRKEGNPSLERASANSWSFYDSVVECERGLSLLRKKDKEKILTLRPIYDEIVPGSSVMVPGAKNVKIFSAEHMLSGALCMTLYSKIIKDFIRK